MILRSQCQNVCLCWDQRSARGLQTGTSLSHLCMRNGEGGREKGGGQREEREGRESWKGRRKGGEEGTEKEGKGKELEVTFQLSQSGSFRLGDGDDYNPSYLEVRRR